MEKKLAAASIIVVSALLLYSIIMAEVSGPIKFIIALVILGGCGISLQALLKMEGQAGLLLLRTERGLRYIDMIANAAPRLWQACADFGTVLGFGLSSIFFFKNVPKKTYLFSILVLITAISSMAPKVFSVVLALINVPMDLRPATEQMGSASTLLPILVSFATIFFGLCGMTVVGLALNTYSILSTVFSSLTSVPGADLSNAVPGASPVIPGINMPFAEGIIALGVLLVIHEVSHGILSRIGKVKLQSAGLLLFGIIPVGAFIDPDEKSLIKKDVDTQTRVFAAGSASNLITFMLFFILLMGFESATYSILDPSVHILSVEPDSPAALAGIKAGDILLSVDNLQMSWDNMNSLGDYVSTKDKVTVLTDKGAYEIVPKPLVKDGPKLMGVKFPHERPFVEGYGWLAFVKNTLGLIFVLNFLVGVINMIPLFMAFDGYRILSLHLKNELALKAISYSLLAMFLLNILPWLWR